MVLLCGIDEAGRGPVIGPLVMAGVVIENTDEAKLKEIGVKDSKLLDKKEREELFKKILGIVKEYKIISLTPDIIDETLKSPSTNLNMLEAETTSEILNELKPDKAIIDLPDRDQERYQGFIRKNLENKKLELITEHKADFNYPVVSAASILAKVTRDRYIEHLKETFGEDFGSGYTSDEKTVKFIEKHWNNDRIHFIRKEWATWKDMKREKQQKRLGEF
jgi:ribonuclease HII